MKSDGHHLNQVTEVNTIKYRTNWNYVPTNGMQWEELSSTPVIFLTRVYNLNLLMRKHQTNANGGTCYQITGLSSSNASRLWKSKIQQLFPIEGYLKGTWQINAIGESGCCLFAIKNMEMGEISRLWGVDGSKASVLFSWFLWLWCDNIFYKIRHAIRII